MNRISSDTTLRALDAAGHDVRAWCFRCARGDRIDSMVWMVFAERGWPMTLAEAASRFRCKWCGKTEHVLLVPATRPPELPWDRQVVAFFHSNRSAMKKRLRRVR